MRLHKKMAASLLVLLMVYLCPRMNIYASQRCCEGDWWLGFDAKVRQAYVVGIMQGLTSGFQRGCGIATQKTAQASKDRTLDQRQLIAACIEQAPDFRQDSDFYVNLATELYQNYPEDKSFLVREILLTSGKLKEAKPSAEQIHKALHSLTR